MDPVYTWLLALVAFIVIEIATMGLTTIWFAGGALVALILALLNTSFYVQAGVPLSDTDAEIQIQYIGEVEDISTFELYIQESTTDAAESE